MWIRYFRFEFSVNVLECKYQLELIIRPLRGASTVRPHTTNTKYLQLFFDRIHPHQAAASPLRIDAMQCQKRETFFRVCRRRELGKLSHERRWSRDSRVKVQGCVLPWQWIASAIAFIMVTWLCGIPIETLQLDNNAGAELRGACEYLVPKPARTSAPIALLSN